MKHNINYYSLAWSFRVAAAAACALNSKIIGTFPFHLCRLQSLLVALVANNKNFV